MSHHDITSFSDPGSFQTALSPLREATFTGRDLVCDPSGCVTLSLVVPAAPPRRMARRAFRKVVVTVRGARNYRQSLTAGPDAVYVLDRTEVGRGGHEIAFYFRPGDRAVMDVDGVVGSVRHTGETVAPQVRPAIRNPLAITGRSSGLLARIFGRV